MGFDFIADRPSLNFIATVAERGTTHLEMLRGGHDLERWITESGLVQNRAVVTAEQLERAVAAREAIFGLIRSLIDDVRGPRTAS